MTKQTLNRHNKTRAKTKDPGTRLAKLLNSHIQSVTNKQTPSSVISMASKHLKRAECPPIPPTLKQYLTPEAPIAKGHRVTQVELKKMLETSQVKVTHPNEPSKLPSPKPFPPESLTPHFARKHETEATGSETEHKVVALFEQTQITNTTQYPYCCVGILLISVLNSAGRTTSNTYCTGVLVGKNMVLTDGYVLPWNQSYRITFIPGYNSEASNSAPFGTANVTNWYGYDPPQNQTQQNYAVCHLDSDIGYKTNWMGTAWFGDDGVYQNNQWNSVGYPSGNVQIAALQINPNNIQDNYGSTQVDTSQFASGGWVGGPMWNFGNAIFQEALALDANSAYCVAVWVGTNSTGGFLGIGNTTYDAHVGGQDMVNCVVYGINNWS